MNRSQRVVLRKLNAGINREETVLLAALLAKRSLEFLELTDRRMARIRLRKIQMAFTALADSV